MDDLSLKAVLVSQSIVFFVFILQKIVSWVLHFSAREKEKKDDKIDAIGSDILDMKIKLAAQQAQLEQISRSLYSVVKVEKDLNAIFKKLREKEDS